MSLQRLFENILLSSYVHSETMRSTVSKYYPEEWKGRSYPNCKSKCPPSNWSTVYCHFSIFQLFHLKSLLPPKKPEFQVCSTKSHFTSKWKCFAVMEAVRPSPLTLCAKWPGDMFMAALALGKGRRGWPPSYRRFFPGGKKNHDHAATQTLPTKPNSGPLPTSPPTLTLN